MIQALYPIFRHWNSEGTLWILSDTHFGEPKPRDIPSRPTDEVKLRTINSCIGKRDTLILLGDVGDPLLADHLKGRKILIAGNHEPGLTTFKDTFFEVYSGPVMISEKLILSHEPINLPFAANIHGHNHSGKHNPDPYHFNVCGDVVGYVPMNLNQWFKQGHLAHIPSIHRMTINQATERKRKKQ